MRPTRFAVLAALALALVPATRLDAQTPAAPAPGAHAHGQHHAQHHAQAGPHDHQKHQGAHSMACAHGGAHTPTPAMLLTHRSDLALTDAQARRLAVLKQDDAAGARAVLTTEQRTRLDAMHASMARMHQAGGHAGHAEHADCADCCKDGKCCGEGACKDAGCCKEGECCTDGKCDAEKCRACCERMGAAAKDAQAPPRT